MLTDGQIGASIRANRLALNLSQTELGAKLGIHISKMSRLENGIQSVSFALAVQISNALDVSLHHLAQLASTYAEPSDLLAKKARILEELESVNKEINVARGQL